MRLTYPFLKSMPKIDLHRHLEGSLRLETLLEIAHEQGLDLPAADVEALRPFVQMTDDEPDFQVFLQKFHVLRRFYQSPEVVKRLVYEAIVDAAADNVHYLELRFSPQALARARGFSLRDVTEWVIEATQRAQTVCKIDVSLVISLLRHEPDRMKEVADIAFELAGKGIVGLDLAGDEVNYPSRPFVDIFQEAKKHGLGTTVHAGEWSGASEVRLALEVFEADRIGHGVRVLEDSHAVAMARERQVPLEVCLTSNLQTGVVSHIRFHPLVHLLREQLAVTLNSDDPSVFNCTLTDDFQVATSSLGLGYGTLRHLLLTAANAAFLEPAQRQKLVHHFASSLPEVPEQVAFPNNAISWRPNVLVPVG